MFRTAIQRCIVTPAISHPSAVMMRPSTVTLRRTVLTPSSRSGLLSSCSSSSSSFHTCARCSMSVFSSEGPSDALARLKALGNATTSAEVLDSGVPLGAPKPSVLNKLRASGRGLGAAEQKTNSAEEKIRRALEYKQLKKEAEEKRKEEEAAKAAAQKK